MNSASAALFVNDLCKSFGKIRAVDHVSLEVRPGEMVGFLGPNGAGKSTCLYMITGLVHPCGGAIEIFGANLRRQFKRAMRHMGALVEAPAFYEYLSARGNLEIVARSRGEVPRSQVEDVLKKVGLYQRSRNRVSTYSHGMKQRLAVASALLGRPRLLVLDEPTSNLDPETSDEVLNILRNAVEKEALAVLLSSHLLSEVEEYCDRVFIINQGKIVASGKVEDILRPDNRVLQVGFSGAVPSCEAAKNY
jgi:ABC-2 type transport system ATP-binding protein